MSDDPTARTRKSFWLTREDVAALVAMAGGHERNCSAKLRDLIREAWARLPVNQPQIGAVPTMELEGT